MPLSNSRPTCADEWSETACFSWFRPSVHLVPRSLLLKDKGSVIVATAATRVCEMLGDGDAVRSKL